jgi:hypothetical protein
MHGSATRWNQMPMGGPSGNNLSLVANLTWPGVGKTHGSPAVDGAGRVFAVFWNDSSQGAGFPFLRRWDNPGPGGGPPAYVDAPLPNVGSDIMTDARDALWLGLAGPEVLAAFVTLSYYNTSLGLNQSALYCFAAEGMELMWSVVRGSAGPPAPQFGPPLGRGCCYTR